MMTASVLSSTSDSFSYFPGTYFGTVMYGENGYVDGPATVQAGTGDMPNSGAYLTWDDNPDDGIDSGAVGVSLRLNTSGGAFEVANSGDLAFSSGSSGSIHQVTIQADVAGPYMQMSWQKVQVSFYRGGQLVETVDVGDVTAGTLDGTTYGASESIVTVNTNASDYDGVFITGEASLSAAAGVYPDVTDIFGKITIS